MASEPDISALTDLALYGPHSRKNFDALCESARRRRARAIIVPARRVGLAREVFDGIVAGHLYANHPDVLRYETEVCIDEGAQEIQTFFDFDRLTELSREVALRDLRDIVEAADERPVTVDTKGGRDERFMEACEIVRESGAKCLHIVSLEAPELVTKVRELVGPTFQLKVCLGTLRGSDGLGETRHAPAEYLQAGANSFSAYFVPGA